MAQTTPTTLSTYWKIVIDMFRVSQTHYIAVKNTDSDLQLEQIVIQHYYLVTLS